MKNEKRVRRTGNEKLNRIKEMSQKENEQAGRNTERIGTVSRRKKITTSTN